MGISCRVQWENGFKLNTHNDMLEIWEQGMDKLPFKTCFGYLSDIKQKYKHDVMHACLQTSRTFYYSYIHVGYGTCTLRSSSAHNTVAFPGASGHIRVCTLNIVNSSAWLQNGFPEKGYIPSGKINIFFCVFCFTSSYSNLSSAAFRGAKVMINKCRVCLKTLQQCRYKHFSRNNTPFFWNLLPPFT